MLFSGTLDMPQGSRGSSVSGGRWGLIHSCSNSTEVIMSRNSFFQYAVGALVATPILWGLIATSAIGDDGHHLLSSGLTIGGPGHFKGKDGDLLLIHSSETARTLCVTLDGKKGTTSALFDLAPVFEVTKDEEKSVCRDSVRDVTLTCVGRNCEGRWRVDTIGSDGKDGVDGALGLPGQTGGKGDKGDKGAQGPVGNDGAPGADGATWITGTGLPAETLWNVGDFYLD